jgi:hypothetical protein
MATGGPLDQVCAALAALGGYFVWRDRQGEEYVVLSRRDFEAKLAAAADAQLDLLNPPKGAGETLERVDRDLAVYQLEQEAEAEEQRLRLPKAPRVVRFEPLRGDLPPELQE